MNTDKDNMTLHKKHYLRLFLIIIATIFYFLANIQRVAIPGAIFDLLQSDLASCASKITLLGAIFCYVYAVVQLVVGLMVDKIGGFRVIAIGSVAFALGAIMFPHSKTFFALYLSRALIGFGSATFYLSTVREVKKYVQDKNFTLAISYILFFGYSGGIIANAPLVSVINKTSWQSVFSAIGMFSILLCVVYLAMLFIFRPTHIETSKEYSLAPFREILTNKYNINLYIFGSINYGLYYVLQSVIGKKFLQDFCFYNVSDSAMILSFMALVSAAAGTITAFISKCINNRRAVIFKTYAILSCLSALCVCLFLIFDVHSKVIALIFCIPSFIGSISPILISTLHVINRYEVSATAVAVQTFGFFMTVGIFGTLCGVLMNVFEPVKTGNVLVYTNNSYLLVFGVFFILSIIEVFCAYRTKDKY